jgi:hypothetical protein
MFEGNDSEYDTYHSLSPSGFYTENDFSPNDEVSNAETEQEYEEHQAQLNTELKVANITTWNILKTNSVLVILLNRELSGRSKTKRRK